MEQSEAYWCDRCEKTHVDECPKLCDWCTGTGKRVGCELWAANYPCETCGGSGLKQEA